MGEVTQPITVNWETRLSNLSFLHSTLNIDHQFYVS